MFVLLFLFLWAMQPEIKLIDNPRTPERTTTGGPRYRNDTAGVDTFIVYKTGNE